MPIRELVQIDAWKGAAYSPTWGVSLDFVPHVSGKTLRWHRTPKSAAFDLRIDSRRSPRTQACMFSALQDIAPMQREVAAGAVVATSDALDWFASISTTSSLVVHFRRAIADNERRFDMWYQQRLAWAFLLAHLGDRAAASLELETWIARHANWVDSSISDALRKRLDAASAAAP